MLTRDRGLDASPSNCRHLCEQKKNHIQSYIKIDKIDKNPLKEMDSYTESRSLFRSLQLSLLPE